MTIDWQRERLLILAPHPDDETLGCGGLMAKAKEAGAEVYVQFMTVGDTADNSARGISTAQERYSEIKQVADFFEWDGWEIAFPGDEYHLKLDRIPRFELANTIEQHSPLSIATLRPTVVITPHWTSYNQDHQVTAEAAHTALRPSNNSLRHHPRVVLAYEEAADQWRYDAVPSPNLLVELTEEHLSAKVKAMGLYCTQAHQHPHTRSETTLRSLAALRGMQTGVALAEGYHTLRLLT
ncbi:PIG-L deacetylase family protein [Nocardiopsis ansamitocini]|uniref:PIG-L domain-containing protein n=1 Tax=Nocardiopsis ansamitocini TaxID=1670832 RepID=A0A9W6P4M3_9ACTN|nr:PIG-L family deacetylase [Nocardiopsis ansamitocini]GLU47260.1 PIG-L domain-containing protein [Nocardiopsis ansamitocini]